MRFLVPLLLLAACQHSDVSRELGARCLDSTECDDRCLGPNSDWPGGFCTIRCEQDYDCPEGVCIDEEGGVCAFSCTTDTACTFLGPGYRCVERDARGGVTKRMVCRGG